MALDLATQEYLAARAKSGGKPLHELSVEEARIASGRLATLIGAGPDVEAVTDIEVQDIPVRIFDPGPGAAQTMVYFHGGGWVLGGLDDYDHLARRLAIEANCVVILPEYSKAPEHQYPAAVEDAIRILDWVSDPASAKFTRQLPVVLAGDSAGGALAAVCARHARDKNIPILLQVLVHPVMDADFERESYLDPANQLTLSRETMEWFWDHYLPERERRTDPDASPLRAEDLEGLAPAFVIVAEHDVLRSEGEAYVDRLRAAGVESELKVADGQTHAFIQMIGLLPGAAAARAAIADVLTRTRSGAMEDDNDN